MHIYCLDKSAPRFLYEKVKGCEISFLFAGLNPTAVRLLHQKTDRVHIRGLGRDV